MKNKIYNILSKNNNEFTQDELQAISDLVEQYGGSIQKLKYYIRTLELENERSRLNRTVEKNTISYQLGKSLIDAAKRKTTIRTLSRELYDLYGDALSRKNSDLKNTKLFHKIVILLNEQKKNELNELRKTKDIKPSNIVTRKNESTSKNTINSNIERKLNKIYSNNNLLDNTGLQTAFLDKNIKIAAIMDEFTSFCFDPEADIYHVTPDNWQSEIIEFKPDVLFIESAWQGKDGLWALKVSQQSEELVQLIDFCQQQGIKTVFWCKEDPVHFGTFLGLAKLVDVVFTTDVDCIQKYKNHVNHDDVYLLCFAAQPTLHNPIERYERKDKFNFAGSYYLKYPVRQRDFSVLSEVAQNHKGLDIFDRNFNKTHPHYQFPDIYQPMILGSLQPSEIDKAYKGYIYGINMNTIKQSQTMFARRVFEMLASNTIVVSNYSHGVRLLFGDLVICSDEATELTRQLEKFTSDIITQKKYKLQGLRKVLGHHTYQHRLKYVLEKAFGTNLDIISHQVIVIAHVNHRDEFDNIIRCFKEQKYSNKILLILSDLAIGDLSDKNITIYNNKSEFTQAIQQYQKESYVAVFNPKDSYGNYYLTDLIQSYIYLEHDDSDPIVAITKDSYFENVNGETEVILGREYKPVNQFQFSKSLVTINTFRKEVLEGDKLYGINDLQVSGKSFSIDCFNYIMNGASLSEENTYESHSKLILDEGVDFEDRLLPVSEAIDGFSEEANIRDSSHQSGKQAAYQDTSAFIFSADNINDQLIRPKSKQVTILKKGESVRITSTLPAEKFAYVYFKTIYERADINLLLNSQFIVDADTNMDIRSVFVFLDENKDKLSHHIAAVSHDYAMPIPPKCKYIKIGFKLTGSGKSEILSIKIGEMRETVNSFIGKSDVLVLAKQYPSYDDLYKYGFLHTRLKSYKDEGLFVDMYKITNDQSLLGFREFESIDVFTGNYEVLKKSLASGQYKKILIHLMDKNMWQVIREFKDELEIYIWVHGAEIQVWQHREFEFELMNEEAITRQKRLSNNRKKFWQNLIDNDLNENIHFIFVSQYFLEESEESLGRTLPRDQVSIIHNYIDNKQFNYISKNPEQRFNILSIRPYASRKYANDLTVNTILELSNHRLFDKMKFTLYGEGELFDETLEPLKKFENVSINKTFLNHFEISTLHKKNGIFVTPTRMDSQGVSRDEAMSSGLIPVTTAVTAIPEFVDDSCGILADGEDYRHMAEGIIKLIENKDIFLDMSKQASERVKKQSGFENTIAREIALIK